MTFGFFLRVLLSHPGALQSDIGELQLTLPEPIGTVVLTSRRPAKTIGEERELKFRGSGYRSNAVANEAGITLADAIRRTSLRTRTAVDVGDGRVRTRLGKVVVDLLEAGGAQLVDDVHGLVVFEEIGTPTTMSMRANLTSSMRLEVFTADLQETSAALPLTARKRLAVDLFVRARSESSSGARHVTLVTALEVLATRQPRMGRAAELVAEFLSPTTSAKPSSPCGARCESWMSSRLALQCGHLPLASQTRTAPSQECGRSNWLVKAIEPEASWYIEVGRTST